LVESGALTAFEEVEATEITEIFGNVAHRFKTAAVADRVPAIRTG